MKEEEFRYKDNTEPAFSGYEVDGQTIAHEDKDKRIADLEEGLSGAFIVIDKARANAIAPDDELYYLKQLKQINELLEG